MRLLLKIFILVLTKSVCFGQIGTCDTAYSTYSGKEQEIRKLAKRIEHFNFSADTKQNLEVAFEQSDFGLLEEIIYPVLVERWCNDTYELSKLILNLDIPNLNNLVIIYSFKNYYPLEIDKISSFCYFQDRIISIKNPKDIEFLKSADTIILVDSSSLENSGHLANLQRVISVMDEIKEEKKCP